MSHPISGHLIDQGTAQVSATWTDPPTGLRCKMRCDCLVQSDDVTTVLDLKSTLNATDFARTAYNNHYFVQAAFYLDGLSLNGIEADGFVFVVVERVPPFGVAVFALDNEDVIRGRKLYTRWINRLLQCRMTNEYPSYDMSIQPLSLPGWARRQLDDQ